MNAILGEADRLKALAADFVDHYEARIKEGTTVAGKAMFVSSNRHIAYNFYKEVIDSDHLAGEPQVPAERKGADHRLYRDQKADEPGPGAVRPPVDRDEVYQKIFEQAENFKEKRS